MTTQTRNLQTRNLQTRNLQTRNLQARNLQAGARPQKQKKASHHSWTQEEKDIVRREYAGTNRSRHEIAVRIGVSDCAVTGQITKMGLAKITDRRPWTDKEEEKLAELIGRETVPKIAKIMKRTINAINVRAKRIHAMKRDRNGWYTKREVSEILGTDHHWVQKRIENGSLRATRNNEEQEPRKNRGAYWRIDEKDLKEFIRRHPQELNGRNVNLCQVVEILAGLLVN